MSVMTSTAQRCERCDKKRTLFACTFATNSSGTYPVLAITTAGLVRWCLRCVNAVRERCDESTIVVGAGGISEIIPRPKEAEDIQR